jgi:GDP-L-fucose synthase
LIESAHRAGVKKFLFLGSSCIYPKHAPQPMREDMLMTGPLEPTNQAYAVAKLAGIEMVRSYQRQFGMGAISVLPTNLYGPFDNFDLETSHVVPALLRKVDEAKRENRPAVTIWGSGKPRREFLYVDDMADACVRLMHVWGSPQPVNIGCGEDVTIAELAGLICEVVGFQGKLEFDSSKPDGTPQKLLDVSKLTELGWRPKVSLKQGLEMTYEWFTRTEKYRR